MRGVLVVVEHRQGKVQDVSLEMIAKGRQLAGVMGETCRAVVIGKDCDAVVDAVKPHVTSVLAVDAEACGDYNPMAYQAVLAALVRDRSPRVVLMGHTACGMEYAPRLSAELKWPLASDCVDVIWENGRIGVVRKMYSDKVNAAVGFKDAAGCLVTVRSGALPARMAASGEGTVERVSCPPFENREARRFLAFVAAAAGDVDITQAQILVSVGRGLGDPDNLPKVEALADALGATISCSRPVVDKNWLPRERQVGTSGKSVTPKVYIALGISGAFQHVAGMKKAGTIIAVNKDPGAPIFAVADYGVVGDMFEFIAALEQLLKQ